MKKSLWILGLCLCLLLAGCKSKPKVATAEKLPFVINQMEYTLYQNIFFNQQADSYVGASATKEGILIRLEDRWNDMTRYYVWGYMDATKCCDWQWEFVPKDPDSLPADGSLVKMTGVLEHNEKALDKYWFKDGTVELETEYVGKRSCDVDLSLMDSTLERVQLANLQHDPDRYNGKTVCLYGRVMTGSTIQHPYYDKNWTLQFEASEEAPAIGTMVLISGTWEDGVLKDAVLRPTSDY